MLLCGKRRNGLARPVPLPPISILEARNEKEFIPWPQTQRRALPGPLFITNNISRPFWNHKPRDREKGGLACDALTITALSYM